jgi:uncharacterized protein (DUF2141 family)
MNYLITLIISLTIASSNLYAQDAKQTIDVKITNISSDQGTLYVALHSSADTWLGKRFKDASATSKDGIATVTFTEVPQGVYAIAVWHDENDNQIFDTNFLGIPKEPTAASNNATGFMSAPKWNDAKFEVANKPLEMTIKM